ncbi:hypothetical protein K8R66_00455 [bacterium]|nr:hypothetical protein [bacterium]
MNPNTKRKIKILILIITIILLSELIYLIYINKNKNSAENSALPININPSQKSKPEIENQIKKINDIEPNIVPEKKEITNPKINTKENQKNPTTRNLPKIPKTPIKY